jgi:hypothetical protein
VGGPETNRLGPNGSGGEVNGNVLIGCNESKRPEKVRAPSGKSLLDEDTRALPIFGRDSIRSVVKIGKATRAYLACHIAINQQRDSNPCQHE